jgi:hypothetical protein
MSGAADIAALDLGGRLTLSARKRTLTLSALRLELGRHPALSAKVGGRRVVVLAVAGASRKLAFDATSGTAKLRPALATLTARGTAAIRDALGVDRLPTGALGTVAAAASLGDGATIPGGATAPGGSSGGGNSTATPGPDTPATTPIGDEPPVLARPATAIDVAGATITWHVRDSFIQYINAGEGTTPSDGATGDPPAQEPGSDALLVYQFHFPFAAGWYDPPSGTAGLNYAGTVNFSYRAHGIDLDAKNPEVELTGNSSRAIFRFSGSGGTDKGDKRAVLVDLHPSGPTTTSPDGRTFTYERVPATIPAGSDTSVFAGFYQPGDPFGWMSVSFTTA